ncbi:secreted RxLR effector protein 161-like [Henckelia pumila]|uniref:secreted RxLR effector protein 161-like n=1 Tax=Henckelia pumila TaxID=405737 RepID=UPI003C6E062F
MKNFSPSVAPVVKGDKFNLDQCPKNDFEREQMKNILYAFSVGSLKRTENLEVIGYSDSDYAGCIDSRKSTFGYIFLLAGGAVSWRSTKQSLSATSIMEAEFVSCFEATSHGVWMKSFISELRVVDSISRSLRIFCDNSTVVFMAKNNKNESRSKHIDIKYLAIRDSVSY